MRNLKDEWHCYKIHFSDEDHEKCITASEKSHFIFFMGHGGETKLSGSCGKNGELYVDSLAQKENSDYYNKDTFIDSSNIGQFKGKIFFCFSCNSNRNSAKSIGRVSIQNGVLAFVGFGDIPTDYVKGVNFSKRCIAIYKGLIIKIMKHAVHLATEGNMNINALVRLIQILTTKEIQKLMMTKADIRHKESIINQLVHFKNDIKIFGNRYVAILS